MRAVWDELSFDKILDKRPLKRTQEIQKILLLALSQSGKKTSHNSIRLGSRTPVFSDCPFQIRSSAVMKEEDALSEPPKGVRYETLWTSPDLE
jgi:hypothetical protein